MVINFVKKSYAFLFMIILHQIFSNDIVSEIPSKLNIREVNLSHQVIPLVIISFIMITFAKFQNNSIFRSLFKLLGATKNFEQILKEELKLGSSSSVALIINYFFIISTCVFLSIQATTKSSFLFSFLFSLAIPIGVFILQILSSILILFPSCFWIFIRYGIYFAIFKKSFFSFTKRCIMVLYYFVLLHT